MARVLSSENLRFENPPRDARTKQLRGGLFHGGNAGEGVTQLAIVVRLTSEPREVPREHPRARWRRSRGFGELDVNADSHRPSSVDDRLDTVKECESEVRAANGREYVVKHKRLQRRDGHSLPVNRVETGDGITEDDKTVRKPIEVLVVNPPV